MGLIIMAAVTTGIALAGGALLLWLVAEPGARRHLIIAFLIALPLEPLVFYVLRLPIDAAIRAGLGTGRAWMAAATLYAPLTEEPAKWLVLAFPVIAPAIRPKTVVPLALAIGLGFGLGEIWFLAHAIIAAPNYPVAPFWMFNGFLIERLEVCFLHGVFLAPVIFCLAMAKPFWPGAVAGVALHFLANLPVTFARADLMGLGNQLWTNLLAIWILALVIAGAFAMTGLNRRLRSAS